MRINSLGFNNIAVEKSNTAKDLVPSTKRGNSLADVEFNIVSDKIRCQNLKNQMSVRLVNLKRNLNICMSENLYKS